MTAICDVKEYGLVDGHAYTILGVHQLTGGPLLLKMRNPHSKEYYTGDFNDSSDKWTDAWKEEVGLTVQDDGIFFMPIENFSGPFSQYDVCQYDTWENKSSIESNEKGMMFKYSFKSDFDQDVLLTWDFENQRNTLAGCSTPQLQFNAYLAGGKPQMVFT